MSEEVNQDPGQGTAPATIEQTQQAPVQNDRFVPLSRFEAVLAERHASRRAADEQKARAEVLEQQLAEIRRNSAPLQQQVQPPQQQTFQQPVQAQPMQQQQPQAPQAQPQINQDDIREMARSMAAAERFTEACNESASAGRKTYTDFDDALAGLRSVAPMRDQQGQPMLPPMFVQAALDTGKAHDVLYALGKDPVEADRIMSLPPTKQAVELTRIADRIDSPNAPVTQGIVTNAPEPIRPVIGNGRGVQTREMPLDDPNLPIEEFMARRNKEAAESRSKMGFRR